ncbi:MAG: Crp/Fnr family transcriptional regulator [Alphaproteobacteria bacterium]|nr:Crp/Fnr family transcriptional regulator [Alphaproteobacteria bacterium]
MEGRRTELARRALGAEPIFAALPAPVLDRVAGLARVERFHTATLLGASGTHLEMLRYVVQGGITMRTRTVSGVESSMPPFAAGQWATWGPCFSDVPLVYDYWALAGSVFIAFPVKPIKSLATSHPQIYPLIVNAIMIRFHSLLEWAVYAGILDEERRIANVLLLATRLADKRAALAVALTQEEVARMAQCSRQTANRILRSLEARGFLERGYRQIRILDPDGLARFTHDGL